MKKLNPALILFFLSACLVPGVMAIQRFPRPEFETGYLQPETLQPLARAGWLAWFDVAMLILMLSLVTWAVLKQRSRVMVFWLSVISLAYFGFYRQGCVCSIGAIQNVALAVADARYAIPATAIAFFLIPLLFTLFFGRTFCAGVCPFGAMQDLVAFKPANLGLRLKTILGLVPYIYLGLSVLFAATASDFIICRYDPFVGIFRFNASFGMFMLTGAILLSGIFIARPYCRFMCPYGVLLNWISRFSWKHLTITPSECIRCRLCEDSCPYEAIDLPLTDPYPGGTSQVRKRLILAILLVPFFTLLGGYTGYRLHDTFAGVNGTVRLARMLSAPSADKGSAGSFEMDAFKSSGKPVNDVIREATAIGEQFRWGGLLLGVFLGLAFGLTLAGKLRNSYRTDYTTNKATCFSCARCVEYCPVDRVEKPVQP